MEAVVAAERYPGPAAGRDPASAAPAAGAPAASPERARRGLASTPWVVSTYFAEGLPFSIAHKVATELFTAMGKSLSEISHASLIGVPWNLKLLWSPLLDVYGTARRWLVLTELALAAAVAGVALVADRGDFGVLVAAFTLVAFVAATHDIAVDGFYLKALDRTQQTALSGLRVAAYRVALIAGGLLVALAGATSWRLALLVAAAAFVALAALHGAVLPSPPAEAAAPGAPPKRVSAEAFKAYLAQPGTGASVAFILVYRAGDAMMFALSSPFLKTLGLETTARGFISSGGTLSSIAGSILGGLIVARLGLRRTIFPIALLQSLAIPLYVALAALRPGAPWVVTLVMIEQLVAGVGTAVLTVFLMRRCSDAYKASHFAIGTAIMSVAVTITGTISGDIAERVGFTAFFAIAFAASIPGVILSRRVPAD